jgi:cell division protein FtsA
VTVSRRDREISFSDIQRVLDAAQSAPLPADREILHAIPQEFVVDEQGGIADPLQMLGSRLEVSVHLVTGQATRSKTLLTCVNRAGIEVTEVVFEALATAEAVLTHDERELGCLLVDVGAGTTTFALFADGEVQHSAVVPVGAGHFTSDLATVLRTPFAEAERIKLEKGCCLASLVSDEQGVTVPTVAGGGTRVVPKRELCEILQPRGEELFQMVQHDLQRVGITEPPRAGVVLTGGGAQLDGLLELAEQIFNCSVRYGLPVGLRGLVDVINCPTWCTASGLLLYGLTAEKRKARTGKKQPRSVRHLMGTIKSMFSDLL